ncbi:MAG: hypothetical protein K0U66_02275 [Gammaproteobacteria bacterium]|nr:hypothetical protein [Pseudomonadota bacterium]MCH9662469.1 hypothetical protein [Gammaproteobacteria bacterium]
MSARIELTALEPGLWQLSGIADRESVDAFFRSQSAASDFSRCENITIRIENLDITDSAILALLVYWRLNLDKKVRFELNSSVLHNLIKVHRIEHLFQYADAP